MKAKLTTAQMMSLHSGFAYCPGWEIRDAVGFMCALKEPSTIVALSLQPTFKDVLGQQFPWLESVPSEPKDWAATLHEFQSRYGLTQTVTCPAEHYNRITAVHEVPDSIVVV